jgi:predicted transcriptional regulator
MMRNVTNGARETVNDDELARFVERFALMLVDSGVPRMPARVFGSLLVSEEGKRTAGELADALRVSPAAISGAVRYLAQVGLVVRARDPGERRDHYEVTDDLWYEAYANRDKQLAQWATLMGEGADVVGAQSKAGARLAQSRRFFDFLREEMPGLMRRWREYEREHPD